MRPEQYNQRTLQNIPWYEHAKWTELKHMPETLMDRKQDVVSFPEPLCDILVEFLLIYRISISRNLTRRSLNRSPGSEEPRIAPGIEICATHSRVKSPSLLPSPPYAKQGLKQLESDSPAASSQWIVLTSFLTLPLLERTWQYRGVSEFRNAQDLGVREESQSWG